MDIGTPGLNSGILGVHTSGQASISAEISTKDPNNENFCAWGTGLQRAAFLWQRGVLTQLPTLGGNNSTLGNINRKGEIAGATENSARDPDCPSKVTVAGTDLSISIIFPRRDRGLRRDRLGRCSRLAIPRLGSGCPSADSEPLSRHRDDLDSVSY